MVRSTSYMMPHLLSLSILLVSLLTIPTLADPPLASSSASQGLTTVSSSALLSLPTASAPPKQPNGDPCGPDIQDNPNYPNTCNLTPSLVTVPSPYGINCTRTIDVDRYPALRTQWDVCAASLESICRKMEDPRTTNGRWIWSMLAGHCALGFWLPPMKGAAPRPSTSRCLNIFTAMVDSCSTTTATSNLGSINLLVPPGFNATYWLSGADPSTGPSNDIYSTGQAVNVGYPSYIVAESISTSWN